MKDKPGYFAVIPSAVRYNQDLQPNAKLMYGEISALCNATGYCWASDQFFADNFGVTLKTVQNLLASLQDHQFIHIEEAKKVDGGKLRKIYLNPAALIVTAGNASGVLEKIFQNSENNFQNLENFFQRIYSNNNIINIPPIAPQGGKQTEPKKQRRRKEDAPEFEPERFEKFWNYYRSLIPKIPGGVRIGGKASAQAAWNSLHPDADTRKVMLAALTQESATKDWQSGHGIKYVSTWLNSFARGDACEIIEGAGDASAAETEVPKW